MGLRETLEDYEEFLDRFDIDISDVHSWEQMRDILESKWQHAYPISQEQFSALETAYERAAPVERPPPQNQYYRVTSSGNVIPKLASRGIRRISYGAGSGRQTRYLVPGYRGLYGLSRARELFRTL